MSPNQYEFCVRTRQELLARHVLLLALAQRCETGCRRLGRAIGLMVGPVGRIAACLIEGGPRFPKCFGRHGRRAYVCPRCMEKLK
jgi:hypothetical protein